MDLSVIIPVYNSEKIINNLVDQIIDSIKNIHTINSYEIILINDCSPDSSWEKIKLLSKKYSVVKGISLAENFGQHNAIMAGLKECSGEKIITMDDDLQHPPQSIKNLVDELDKNFDVSYTKYLNRQHPFWKKIVSWLNNLVSSFLLNKPYHIYLSSFRAFKKNIAKEILNYEGSSIYLDSLILKATRNISIIPVEHKERPHGFSNYSFRKLLLLWSDMIVDLKIYPVRFSSIFIITILPFIIIIRKILFSRKKNKKKLYVIKVKTE